MGSMHCGFIALVFAWLLSTAVNAVAVQPYYRESFVTPKSTFAYNHGSALAEIAPGQIFITWFAGSAEIAADVQIYGVRYAGAAGPGYSRPSVIVQKQDKAEGALWRDKSPGNTALFFDADRVLWLFYNAVVIGGWSGALVNYKVSYDMGLTWTRAARFVGTIGNLSRSVPLPLGRRVFLVPLYTSLFSRRGYTCRVEHAAGKIRSQRCGAAIPGKGAIQPALARTRDGSILMLLRDRENKFIRRSWSHDDGQTWSALDQVGLPNPDAPVGLTRLVDGRLLLVYNHSSQWRAPLSLALSEDNGKTFHRVKDLESERGSFGYPAIVQAQDSLIHVTYSYNQATIKHVVFNADWLMAER